MSNTVPTLAEIYKARDNILNLDTFVNSTSITFVDTDGKTKRTLTSLVNDMYLSPVNGGVWSNGEQFNYYNEYMVYNGQAYKPNLSTALPYTIGATPDFEFVELVGNTLSIINPVILDIESRVTDNELDINALQLGQGSGVIGYATQALLYADLSPIDKYIAYVTNDTTPTKNGTYRKSGDTGVGSWIQTSTDLSNQAYQKSIANELDLVRFHETERSQGVERLAITEMLLTNENALMSYATSSDPYEPTGTFAGYCSGYISKKVTELEYFTVKISTDLPCKAKVQIYDNSPMEGGTLLSDQLTEVNGEGYYSVQLDTPVSLTIGQVFWVGIRTDILGQTVVMGRPNSFGVNQANHPNWAIDSGKQLYCETSGDGISWPTRVPAGTGLYVLDIKFFDKDSIVDNRLIANNAVNPITNITYASSINVSDVVSTTIGYRATAFTGWASNFNRQAAESFNSLRVIGLKSGELKNLARVNFYVKDATTLEVIASADVYVGIGETDYSDVRALLRGANGNVITLNSGNLPSIYRVGYRGYDESGNYAVIGHVFGTAVTSFAGNSYYQTVDESYTAYATLIAIERVALTTPVDNDLIKVKLSALPSSALSKTAPELFLPTTIYAAQGNEFNFYFDNAIAQKASDYNVNVELTTGAKHLKECMRIASADIAAGTYPLTLEYRSKVTNLVEASAICNIQRVASSQGTGLTKKVLVIGDSLINAGVITQTLLDDAGAPNITLQGTRGTAPNLHEGRGGWSIDDYTGVGRTYYRFTVSGVSVTPAINSSGYTDSSGAYYVVQETNITAGSGTVTCSLFSGTGGTIPSGNLTKVTGVGDATIAFSDVTTVSGNPFWNGSAVDFANYLSVNGFATPDIVIIALGINDVFVQTDDAAVTSLAASKAALLDTLVTSIHAHGATIKVGIALPTPPSGQDAFGVNYDAGQYYARDKRNIYFWSKAFNAYYTGKEGANTYVLASNYALDTDRGYPVTTAAASARITKVVERQNNGVHPSNEGYQQIGDAMFAFIKAVS
jgi:lysophospholipase L1-like esterase